MRRLAVVGRIVRLRRVYSWLLPLALVVCVASAGQAGTASAEVPSVILSWSMPSRYELGWYEWKRFGKYASTYVRPPGWTASFDLCRTTRGVPVTRYDLTIVGVGFHFRTVANDRLCHKTFHGLPRLGTYDVIAAAESRDGVGPAVEQRIELKDYLIVSLGDSFASGEGSPDKPGSYDVNIPSTADFALGADVTTRERRPPEWQDLRCHRSARSAHALLAKKIEDADAHSSVTFVSLACSGAEVDEGLLGPYGGSQPPAGADPLPPQVDALTGLVGSPGRPGPSRFRPIDALLLQIGINDLGFSDILHACATNVNLTSRCFPNSRFNADLTKLRQRYEQVGRTLAKRFPGAEVYIADYPGDVLVGGGCGTLGRAGVGITEDEGSTIAGAGRRFAAEIQRAAVTSGWNYVGGVTKLFSGHAYCSQAPWFTTFEQSYAQQGNDKGTAHPNPDGYKAFAAKLGSAVVVDHERQPAYNVRLVIEKARVGTALDLDRSPACALKVAVRRDGLLTPVTTFDLPVFGRLVEPIGGPITFNLPVYRAPQPSRHLTGISFSIASAGQLPATWCMNAVLRYGPGQVYGSGKHTFRTKDGYAELDYRIEATRTGPVVGG